jgi:hypothetical protein
MSTTASRTATPKPTSTASRYDQQQARSAQLRMGLLAIILLGVIVPWIPSPVGPLPNPFATIPGQPDSLGPWEWRAALLALLAPTLTQELIPAGMAGFPHPALTPWLILRLGIAVGGLVVILGLVQHVLSLYAQRTTPLTATHTYVRLRVPGNTRTTPQDGVTLLRTLHGMLPPANPMKGTPVPITLRWSAQPEMPVTQGITVCGQPTLVMSIIKTLEGITRGAAAEAWDDPLLAACTEGRWLCWADVQQAAPSVLPIAVASKSDDPLLAALLPALSPQGGVVVADVQILLVPLRDRAWRIPVLAQQERRKLDLGSSEKQALDAKAAGPAFRVGMRLRVIAESAELGTAMVQTLAATLSSSAQASADSEQRLMASAVQTLPAQLPPPPALPRALWRGAWAFGGILLPLVALGVWYWPVSLLWWALPILALPLPPLILGAWHRRRAQADLRRQHAGILGAILPPVNPKTIPIFHPWFGYPE